MKTPADALLAIEAKHAAQVQALEDGARRALLRTYRNMLADMEGRLARAITAERTFTATHLAAIAAQVTGALDDFSGAAGELLLSDSERAMVLGLRQVAREILTAEEAMPADLLSTALVQNLAEWGPQIPVGQVARLAEAQGLLVSDLTVAMRASVGESLAASVAQGRGIAAAKRALRSVMTEAYDWQLERLARTEINNAANVGHESALREGANRFPGLGLSKRWSTRRDGQGVCAVCLALGTQTRAQGEEFSTGTWSGQHPPAHPNCRCRVVPWSDRWAAHVEAKAAQGGTPMSVATANLAATVPVAQTKNGPPPMPTKHAPLVVRFKAITFDDATGTIDGYASCWGDPMGPGDSYGHVMVKGAFLESINQRRAEGRKFAFMWSHGFKMIPVGVVDPADMLEDEKGLRFKAVLDIEHNDDAKKLYYAFKSGAVDSFSIGWNPVVLAYPPEGSKAELLLVQVALEEISAVNFAADKAARVVSVKVPEDDAVGAWLQELQAEKKAGRVLSSANEEKLRQAGAKIAEILSTLPEPKSDPTPEGDTTQDPPPPEGQPEGDQPPTPDPAEAEAKDAISALLAAADLLTPKEA